MKPLKLTMCAFGSYGKETVIDFTKADHGLFLITGDTGTGKTTIFDGITFAIYGETSGGKRDGKMMRSQFASPSEETFVELVFSYRGEVYTVRRSPEYFREKKRGTGLVKSAATVELTMPDGTAFRGKVKETDKKLCEIMGINREQFTQIAMIAQGDFLRLLHAKSEDRKKIFSTIFHTSLYRNVEEELGEKRKELKEKISGTGERVRAYIQGIRFPEPEEIDEPDIGTEPGHLPGAESEDDTGERMDKARKYLKSMEKEENPDLSAVREILELLDSVVQRQEAALAGPIRDIEETYQLLLEKRGLAKSTNDLLEALERAKLKLETYKAAEEEQTGKRNRIAAGEKAFGVKPFEDRRKHAEWALKNAETELETSERQAAFLWDELETIDSHLLSEKRKTSIYRNRQELSALISDWKAQEKTLISAEEKQRELEKKSRYLTKEKKGLEEKKIRLEKQLEMLAEARANYGTLQERFFCEQAGILARERLRPGEPCPVCGATEHPDPAVLSEDAVTENEVKKAQESWEQCRSACEGMSLEIREEGARIREACKQLEEAGKEIPENLDSLKRKVKKAIASAEAYAGSVERNDKSREEVERCRKGLEDAEAEYQKILAESGFCEESYQTAISSWKTRKELDFEKKENERYFTDLYHANTAVQTLMEQSAGKQAVDLSSLDAELAVWKGKKEGLTAKKEQISSRKQSYEQTMRLLDQEERQYHGLLEEFLLYDRLWQVAGGKIKGRVRMDFETYVQRIYFEKILAAANRRFLTFTDGKMKLKSRPVEEMGLVGAAGLELNVYVMATGKERDVKTLSGGESFLASLAMALGLSDVVQSQAGSIRLESMFVDEGFGSLDDHTRAQAIRVLNELAGDDRLVGIISHVNALKDSIEKKLTVTRGMQGSMVSWN